MQSAVISFSLRLQNVIGCNVVATGHVIVIVRYGSVLHAETLSNTESVSYAGSFKLCCEILLLLNIADMDCLSCGKLWSEQC